MENFLWPCTYLSSLGFAYENEDTREEASSLESLNLEDILNTRSTELVMFLKATELLVFKESLSF